MRDARGYVALAEAVNGPIPGPVAAPGRGATCWPSSTRPQPDVRIDQPGDQRHRGRRLRAGQGGALPDAPGQRRMPGGGPPRRLRARQQPRARLRAERAGRDARTLDEAGLGHTGRRPERREAQRPAAVTVGRRRRVVVHAVGTESSGVPPGWAATRTAAGVAYAPGPSSVRRPTRWRPGCGGPTRPGDVVVVSVHGGSNWGYGVTAARAVRPSPRRRRRGRGARALLAPSRPIEVYRGRLILYGCGDLVNDYEGIGGFEAFRSDLRLLYLVTLDADTAPAVRASGWCRCGRGVCAWSGSPARTPSGCSRPWRGSAVSSARPSKLGADGSLLARAADDRR